MDREIFENLAREILGKENLQYTEPDSSFHMQYCTYSKIPLTKIHIVNCKQCTFFACNLPIYTDDLESITIKHYNKPYSYKEHYINLNHPNSIQEAKEYVKRWENESRSPKIPS